MKGKSYIHCNYFSTVTTMCTLRTKDVIPKFSKKFLCKLATKLIGRTVIALLCFAYSCYSPFFLILKVNVTNIPSYKDVM